MGKVRVKDGDIFYREMGSEPPILLFVHGAGGNGRLWLPVLNGMNVDARRIAVDLPQHGNSTGPAMRSIDEYADVIEEFVEKLGRFQTVLVGHSMGGAIALTIGLRNPDWLKGLVLVATGAKLKVADFVFDAIASFSSETARMFAEMLVSEEGVRELVRESFEEIKKEVIEGDFIACNKFNIMDRVNEIKVPSLIICGENDMLTPPKYSEYLHERIKDSHLIIVEGAGHMVLLERPQVLSEEIGNFWKRVRE